MVLLDRLEVLGLDDLDSLLLFLSEIGVDEVRRLEDGQELIFGHPIEGTVGSEVD